jgi:hypothetical protein
MAEPPVKFPLPAFYNLYTDPREEKPTVDTWVAYPMLKIVGAFEDSRRSVHSSRWARRTLMNRPPPIREG